jgi:hypothetical protein
VISLSTHTQVFGFENLTVLDGCLSFRVCQPFSVWAQNSHAHTGTKLTHVVRISSLSSRCADPVSLGYVFQCRTASPSIVPVFRLQNLVHRLKPVSKRGHSLVKSPLGSVLPYDRHQLLWRKRHPYEEETSRSVKCSS